MGLNQQYPVLDGIVPSYADIQFKLAPYESSILDVFDIQAINTSRSVDVPKGRGASGGRTMFRGTGQSDEEASATFYHSGWQKIIRAFKDVAPVRGNQRAISLVHFDLQVIWTPPGSDQIYERWLKGARIIGDTLNSAEGPDLNMVECPLSVVSIVDIVDGVEIVML